MVLDKKTKELLELIASMVLRRDDCIAYHLGTAHKLGVTTPQLFEVFSELCPLPSDRSIVSDITIAIVKILFWY